MRCADARAVMMEILDDLADSAQQAALLSHAAECAACRAEWRALQELDALFTAAPMLAPPPDFTQRVLARLHAAVAPSGSLSPQTIQSPFSDRATDGMQHDEWHQNAHPLGGIAVLVLGGLLLFTLLTAPLLRHVWPTVWNLFTGAGGVEGASLVGNPLLIGVSETLQALWRLHRSVLQAVGPLLIAGYSAVTVVITLLWLRLIIGMQQALSLRQ